MNPGPRFGSMSRPGQAMAQCVTGPLLPVLAAVGPTHMERDADIMAISSRACEAIRDLESLELL